MRLIVLLRGGIPGGIYSVVHMLRGQHVFVTAVSLPATAQVLT